MTTNNNNYYKNLIKFLIIGFFSAVIIISFIAMIYYGCRRVTQTSVNNPENIPEFEVIEIASDANEETKKTLLENLAIVEKKEKKRKDDNIAEKKRIETQIQNIYKKFLETKNNKAQNFAKTKFKKVENELDGMTVENKGWVDKMRKKIKTKVSGMEYFTKTEIEEQKKDD